MAFNKEDFPEPTSPIIPIISPGLTSKFIFFKVTSKFTSSGISIWILTPSFVICGFCSKSLLIGISVLIFKLVFIFSY